MAAVRQHFPHRERLGEMPPALSLDGETYFHGRRLLGQIHQLSVEMNLFPAGQRRAAEGSGFGSGGGFMVWYRRLRLGLLNQIPAAFKQFEAFGKGKSLKLMAGIAGFKKMPEDGCLRQKPG
jgi:hypothetical protein